MSKIKRLFYECPQNEQLNMLTSVTAFAQALSTLFKRPAQRRLILIVEL